MYCKCSFLRVTLVCPPIGPPGTVVARETESGVGMIITNSLYQVLTRISIDKDGVCLHVLSHGFYISKGPSFIASIIVRSKWSSLWRWSEGMKQVYTDSVPCSPSPGVWQLLSAQYLPQSTGRENTVSQVSNLECYSLLPLWCHLVWMRLPQVHTQSIRTASLIPSPTCPGNEAIEYIIYLSLHSCGGVHSSSRYPPSVDKDEAPEWENKKLCLWTVTNVCTGYYWVSLQ